MGREINVETGNRLSTLEAAVVIVDGHRAILIDAFERRQQQVGGEAVMLDAVVEIVIEAGYRGTVERAGSILRREGGFIVEPGLNERMFVQAVRFRPRVPEVVALTGYDRGNYVGLAPSSDLYIRLPSLNVAGGLRRRVSEGNSPKHPL